MNDKPRRRKGIRRALAAVAILGLVWLALVAVAVHRKRLLVWFPAYVEWAVSREAPAEERPVDVMVMFADHFEPGMDTAKVRRWLGRYEDLASRHRDSDGRPPRHTWFYPIERLVGPDSLDEQIELLSSAVAAGLGEVEVHWHHHHTDIDAYRDELREGLRTLQRYGMCKTRQGDTRFAFVHGVWSLDNAASKEGRERCGMNNELSMLAAAGCFADFTFPAIGDVSQPAVVNRIYVAIDDPQEAKSYDRAYPLTTTPPGPDRLVIFEGPLLVDWGNWSRLGFPHIENGGVQSSNPAAPRRAVQWVEAGIHVEGRPNWVFVKLHGHCARDAEMDACLGDSFSRTLSFMEDRDRDGSGFRLHYVTAREAFNIAMAAADGMQGNPSDYRDYRIAEYAGTPLDTAEAVSAAAAAPSAGPVAGEGPADDVDERASSSPGSR